MANELNPAEWNVSQQDYDTLDFLHSGSSLDRLVRDGLQTVGEEIDPNIFVCQCDEPRTKNPMTITYWNFGMCVGSVLQDPTPSIHYIASRFSDIKAKSVTGKLIGYSVWGWSSGMTTYQEPKDYGSMPALSVISNVFGALENSARWYPTQSPADFNDPYAGQYPYLKINPTKICAVIFVDCIKGFDDCTYFNSKDDFIDRVYVRTVTLKEWEDTYQYTHPVIIRAYMPIYLGENNNRSQQDVSFFSNRSYDVEDMCNTYSRVGGTSIIGEWEESNHPQLNTDVKPRGYMWQIMLFEGFRCTYDIGAQDIITLAGMTRGIFRYSTVNRALYKVGSLWEPAAVVWFNGTANDIRNAARRVRLPIAETVDKARYGDVATDPAIELPRSNPDGTYKDSTTDPDEKADELDEGMRKDDFDPEAISENPDVTEGDPEDPDDPDYDPEQDPEDETKEIPLNTPTLGTVGIFNRCYAVNANELEELAEYLWNADPDIMDAIIKSLELMGSDPMNAIISMFMYPFEVRNTGTLENIRIGLIDTEISGLPIDHTSVKVFELGEVYFWEKYKNYLDYEPYTTAQLYIPYVGVMKLPAKSLMRKWVNVKLVVDILTGVGQIVVYARTANTMLPILYRDCAIGTQIAVTGRDAAQIAGNYINAITRIAGSTVSAAQGNISGMIGIAQGCYNLFTAEGVPIESSGSSSPQCSLFMPQRCYLVVNRPIPIDTANYGHLVGFACWQSGVVGNFAGFSKFENVVLDIPTATSEEKTEILRLLETGVFV